MMDTGRTISNYNKRYEDEEKEKGKENFMNSVRDYHSDSGRSGDSILHDSRKGRILRFVCQQGQD